MSRKPLDYCDDWGRPPAVDDLRSLIHRHVLVPFLMSSDADPLGLEHRAVAVSLVMQTGDDGMVRPEVDVVLGIPAVYFESTVRRLVACGVLTPTGLPNAYRWGAIR